MLMVVYFTFFVPILPSIRLVHIAQVTERVILTIFSSQYEHKIVLEPEFMKKEDHSERGT